MIDDVHFETFCPPRHRMTYPSHSDDAESGVVQVDAEQEEWSPGVPVFVLHVVLCFRQAARGGEQQRKGEVSSGVGQDTGRIPGGDSSPRQFVNIQIVEPDREIADDFQIRC